MSKKQEMPLLPLRGVMLFPNMATNLDVGRERSIKAIEEAMSRDQKIFLVSQKDPKDDDPEITGLFRTGTLANITHMLRLPGGTMRVNVEGLNRAIVHEFVETQDYYEVLIENVYEKDVRDPEAEALRRSVLNCLGEYVKTGKKLNQDSLDELSQIEDPGELADSIASDLNLKIEQKQEVLEITDPRERLQRIGELLNYEIEVLELEKEINQRIRKQMEKTQKDYHLREQLRAIQKELGVEDERIAEGGEYREKIEEAGMPEEAKNMALKEVERLEKMPPAAAESVVIRTYLDWMLELPWSAQTEDCLDLDVVERVLDEDHYGLEKVKNRIVEYLAVRQLTQNIKGPILCLIGPPGVGKTSLARSIARAMERNFVRISLGGIRDEAEIRGHRRTYVGAMPGRIIQGIRHARSRNPVFLMDEVDKMSMDFRGDPSSALLEVLDPEQNKNYSDHYIETSFDLSQVMFITTANSRYNIPQPLLDRMETIYIPGYTEEEKVRIAQRHLIPKQLEENGLSADNLRFSEGSLGEIVRQYTREAGVRNLEREIANICRKTAKEVVRNKKPKVAISRSNLHKYIGPPVYRYGMAEKESEVGVATGVAWTETGGDLLAIEVNLMKGNGKLILTGKLGDIMQESAQAALSYIRSRATSLGIEEDFYEKYDLHVHIPEGAIPKEGPSAGLTMAVAMISALKRTPVDRRVAMSGEITLRGRVLPVGGVKEKILAAHRAGIKKVLLPADNKKDLAEIPANVRRRMEFVMVENLEEVLEQTLPAEAKKETGKREEDTDDKSGVRKVS